MADIALKSAVSTNFRHLFNYMSKGPFDDEMKIEILEKHFIPLILKGLNSEKEVI